ncbi:MAG: DUF3575 domain-containing protein [Bacteroidota bacterium]
MKKITLLVFTMLIISTGLYAQKTNVIKTDLFSAFLRTGALKYERALNEDMSIQIGFLYTAFTPNDSDGKLNGFGITPEFRYYLSDTPAPNGTYLAPNLRYLNLTVENTATQEEGTFTSVGFGVNLGKQAVLKDVIAIDAWVGPTYNFRTLVDAGDADAGIPDVNGFGIRLGIAIGIVF